MKDLNRLIDKWAIDRNLQTGDPKGQVIKLGEEFGELCQGIAKDNLDLQIDSIGDMYVVMRVFCLQKGISFENCVQAAYDEIKDRKGKLVDGIFVKESDLKG